eukprot:286793-Prorocentrum_minimum.AAC.1
MVEARCAPVMNPDPAAPGPQSRSVTVTQPCSGKGPPNLANNLVKKSLRLAHAWCMHRDSEKYDCPSEYSSYKGTRARFSAAFRLGAKYSHDGPIRRRNHGYILTMDQSDAGGAGIFSRWTNQAQEAQ